MHKFPVTWSIYQFKYHNRRIYGEFYAKELYRLYGKCIKSWEIDVIVPVPVHPKRKRIRGYNQAEIIAEHLGKLVNLPVETKWVKRSRYTRPQKNLNHLERKKNLEEAFAISSLGTADMTEKLLEQLTKTKNNSDFINIVKEIYKN